LALIGQNVMARNFVYLAKKLEQIKNKMAARFDVAASDDVVEDLNTSSENKNELTCENVRKIRPCTTKNIAYCSPTYCFLAA
jgi:hypothetical protein